MDKLISRLMVAVILGSVTLPVGAEEPVALDTFTLEGVTVEAERPDWESKLSPGSVNVIHPEEYKGEQKTLPELLQTVPGVHIREVNGKGQYTTVTMRGSTAAQVGVFIDGVLANLGGDSAVDLSTIPVKNVERVEVYRGYVPSRFGGTYIGGVINIVTKKPETTSVSAELNRSSFGGKKAALEVTAPLGSGSLMVGINHESSDGAFKYKNYAAQRYLSVLDKNVAGLQEQVDGFHINNIELLAGGDNPLIHLEEQQKELFKKEPESWTAFVRDEKGLSKEIENNRYNYAKGYLTNVQPLAKLLEEKGIKAEYLDLGYGESGRYNWLDAANADWKGSALGEGIITPELKQELIRNYADSSYKENIKEWLKKADPEKSQQVQKFLQQLEENKKRQQESRKPIRYRKYNDFNNGDAIIKWQNKSWVVKGAYNKIDRHLPDSVWGGSGYTLAPESNNVDLYDTFYYDSRRQKQQSYNLMTSHRQEIGKLEWGWTADFTRQNKQYRAETILTSDKQTTDWEREHTPLREWSRYKSNKGNLQFDGSYKLAENNMLDFQFNYSKERMNIQGSNMDKVLSGDDENSILAQMRNRYDQDIFNFQLQNSITLDTRSSWILTPGLRYNQSRITGYSDGKRFGNGYFTWLKPEQSQLDKKLTWQLALKKEINENLTLRMTGGTYFRLLNMYEIAGDGAGILPAPANRNGGNSVFPMPEEGKQFDFSAIFNRKLLGAQNATTLTYYWRDSEKMLQLVRAGRDYWCYFNDNRGKAHGIELQSSFKWSKFDLDLQVTYLKTNIERMNSAAHYDYSGIWATYQPEWESNVRLTYRPTERWDIFLEGHFTDEYFTNDAKSTASKEEAYLSGKPVDKLFTINTGLKFKPHKHWQLVLGCKDIFNRGPKSKIRAEIANMNLYGQYINPEFPLQGRTLYATLKAEF